MERVSRACLAVVACLVVRIGILNHPSRRRRRRVTATPSRPPSDRDAESASRLNLQHTFCASALPIKAATPAGERAFTSVSRQQSDLR